MIARRGMFDLVFNFLFEDPDVGQLDLRGKFRPWKLRLLRGILAVRTFMLEAATFVRGLTFVSALFAFLFLSGRVATATYVADVLVMVYVAHLRRLDAYLKTRPIRANADADADAGADLAAGPYE